MDDPIVQVWFGDSNERELMPDDMFLAVYAAGGGKRNMANFVRGAVGSGDESQFRTSDVHIFLSCDSMAALSAPSSRLFVCRYASSRGEWVPKPVTNYQPGASHLKLIPEWFKARFWDNKQEKKHPWFMFGFYCEAADGSPRFFTSSAFPVHQYYPTGLKKTDPNDPVCRMAFHRVLKQAPSTTLRPENVLRHTSMSMLANVEAQSKPAAPVQRREKAARIAHSGGIMKKLRMSPDAMDEDCDTDGDKFQRRSPNSDFANGFYGDTSTYTEPMRNIGQRGLDAAEALLALSGFPAPMR